MFKMISEKLCRLSNGKSLWNTLQRLSLGTKFISTQSNNNSNKVNLVNASWHYKLIFQNGSLRCYNSDNRLIKASSCNFARSVVLKNSKAHSHCLTSSYKDDLQIDNIEHIIEKQWTSMTNVEILENFEFLSHYAFRNDENLCDPKYRCILEVITTKCPELNDEELHCLLNFLTLWYTKKSDPDYQRFNSLFKACDNECFKRFPNWSIEEILLTNDQFFQLHLSRQSEFTWHSLKRISNKLKKFNAANLIQLAFLLRVNREVPINMYNFEYCLEQYADEFTVEELGVIAMAFVKYGNVIRSSDFLMKFIQKLQDNINTVSDISINSISYILRYVENEEINKALLDLLHLFKTQIPKRPLSTLTSFLDLERRIQLLDKDLTQATLDRCEENIKSMKLKQIETVFSALSTLNYDSKTTTFYAVAIDELLQSDRTEERERYASSFIRCNMLMSLMNLYHEESLKVIMQPEFINKSCKNDMHHLTSCCLVLDYNIELEYPEYNGPRLEQDIRNFLLKKFGALSEKLIHKNSKSYKTDKLMIDVVHNCEQLFGSNKILHIDSLLPQYAKTDIVICYDQEVDRFVPPAEKLFTMPTGTFKYAPNDGKEWYVLMMGTSNWFIRNTSNICGLLAAQMRQLKRIGFKPIVISYYDWFKLADEKEKQMYIKNILYK